MHNLILITLSYIQLLPIYLFPKILIRSSKYYKFSKYIHKDLSLFYLTYEKLFLHLLYELLLAGTHFKQLFHWIVTSPKHFWFKQMGTPLLILLIPLLTAQVGILLLRLMSRIPQEYFYMMYIHQNLFYEWELLRQLMCQFIWISYPLKGVFGIS